MCNFIRSSWVSPLSREKGILLKKIPKSGRGYKWMLKLPNGRFLAPYKGRAFVINQWNIWDEKYKSIGDGFTFFKHKKTALEAYESIKRTCSKSDFPLVLVKIHYDKGIVFRYEFDPAIDSWIGLCKEYVILEESKLPKRFNKEDDYKNVHLR